MRLLIDSTKYIYYKHQITTFIKNKLHRLGISKARLFKFKVSSQACFFYNKIEAALGIS